MSAHPEETTFAEYVIGAFDPDEDFIAHVSTCGTCARKLEAEARLELTLGELRTARSKATPARPRRHVVLGAVVAFAAAAALLLLLRRPSTTTMSICADGVGGTPTAPCPSQTARPAMGTFEAPIPDKDEVIASLRPAFRRCFQQGLTEDLSMEGRVVLQATVAPDGVVTSVVVRERSGLSPAVEDCLATVVHKAKFTGNGTVTSVPVSVTFGQTR